MPRVRYKKVIKLTMFKEDAIATAIRMKCEGKSAAEISEATGHPPNKMRNFLNEVRFELCLPRTQREYVEFSVQVLHNLQKWQEHRQLVQRMQIEFRASLHNLLDVS